MPRKPDLACPDLVRADARAVGAALDRFRPGQDVTCTVTSPPYAWLKDYGQPDQIGHGQTLDAYLTDCEDVFRQIHARTAADGAMWLIADTLVDQKPKMSRLVPLPFLLSERAEAAGWTLRDVVIWQKDRTSPWSGAGRLRNSFEYVLMLVKGSGFKYRLHRARSPEGLEDWWRRFPERYHPLGAAPTNVWSFPIPRQGSWAAGARHACPLPPGLVERILLLSSDPGDLVLDPFAGVGTVPAEARRMGRGAIGLEIDQQHVDAFPSFLAAAMARTAEVPHAPKLTMLVPRLRALKYPRALAAAARRLDPGLPPLALAGVDQLEVRQAPDGAFAISTDTVFVVGAAAGRRRAVQEALDSARLRPPASKFGVTGPVRVLDPDDGHAWLQRQDKWWLYESSMHLRAFGQVTASDALERLDRPSRHPHVCSTVDLESDP